MLVRIAIGFFALAGSLALGQEVHIGVLGLFHPRELIVQAPAHSALEVHAGDRSFVLEPSSGLDTAELQLMGNSVALKIGAHQLRSPEVRFQARDGGPARLILAVPSKFTRHYQGRLAVRASPRELTAVVGMDLETAVASVVAAETTSDTPPEALKAQAVVTRSYLVSAKGRHTSFDFCDTTHCQFLREPPASGTQVMDAVSATRGIVLAFESAPFAAMFTRSCSGQTRTPREIGLPSGTYPYYQVDCRYCREHPDRWQRRISQSAAAGLRTSNEAARLKVVRELGWSTVPSDSFAVRSSGKFVLLDGVGQGHGVGLCQAGAKALAKKGADFRNILMHYFPNTSLVSVNR